MRGRWPSLVSSSLLVCSVPISREHRDKHIWVVREKGGSSNVYISMHLPLLRVEGLESKSSSRHAYAGVIQHDSVAHLAAIIKDMALSIASSSKVLLHGEEITLTDQTEFNDLFSLSKNMQLSERMQHFIRINFRTLGRPTSLLFGAKEKSILIEGSHPNIPAIRVPLLQESCSTRRVFASQGGLVLVSKP